MTKREKLKELLKGNLLPDSVDGLDIPIQFWAQDFDEHGNTNVADAIERFKKQQKQKVN